MSTSNGEGGEWKAAPLPPKTLTEAAVREHVLPALLSAIPDEWRGTTFNNQSLLGREAFSLNLIRLIEEKALFTERGAAESGVTKADLEGLGQAEDYLRVATNVSAMLETVLALLAGHGDVARVISFASRIMPLIAVALTAPIADESTGLRVPVVVYHHPDDAHRLPRLPKAIAAQGAQIRLVAGAPPTKREETAERVVWWGGPADAADVDAVVSADGVLFLQRPDRIRPADIVLIRKRMATPMTTPAALSLLSALMTKTGEANHNEKDENDNHAKDDEQVEVEHHLQEMSGTAVDGDHPPALFIAGLAAIHSMWLSLLEKGPCDVLMCSTAYGGSSQLTDLIAMRARSRFVKHTFDIQGDRDVAESVPEALQKLAILHQKNQKNQNSQRNEEDENQENGNQTDNTATTVLFLEMPTNPDMKMMDAQTVGEALTRYAAQTGRDVVLLVDTTFAPASKTLLRLAESSPQLPSIAFISLSKSVSRGTTTGGALIANATAFSQRLVAVASRLAADLDLQMKPDQWDSLKRCHVGVEERCRNAYENASRAGEALREAVRRRCGGFDMPLAFVSRSDADRGYHTSTFSFNLPPPTIREKKDGLGGLEGRADAENHDRLVATLAQRFVDALTENRRHFKPCVSFGQDNGLVYCTVPATSTQGAIPQEHKEKQARGGVQLVRLSFPPSMDVDEVCSHIQKSVDSVY